MSVEGGQQLYYLNMECVLDSLKCIKDECFYDNENVTPKSKMILQIFKKLLMFKKLDQIYLVVRIIQFFDDYSALFMKDEALSIETIQFLFGYFDCEVLVDNISEVFSSVSVQLKKKIDISIFKEIAIFINDKLPILKRKVTIRNMITGLSKLAYRYMDDSEAENPEESHTAKLLWLELI